MKTQQGGDRKLEGFTGKGGVSYLWFTPTGQYEMKQASDGVRCVRNGSERVLALNRCFFCCFFFFKCTINMLAAESECVTSGKKA